MADPFALSLSVEHKDGRVTRWGPDEAAAKDVPTDLEFGTSMPGGFQDLQSSLLRRIDLDYPDQNLLDTVTAYGSGREVAWQGRMTQFPRSHGDTFTVAPGAEGWVAHLRDDETFTMIFADRDQSGWAQMASGRKFYLTGTAGYRSVASPTAVPDTNSGRPSVHLIMAGPWGTSAVGEAWYDAGPGNKIGAVYVSWDYDGNIAAENGDTNWNWHVQFNSTDSGALTSVSGNLRGTLPRSDYWGPTPSQRYAILSAFYGAADTSNKQHDIYARDLTVYGDHGLTRRGTAPGGFYGGDIVAFTLGRQCPQLTYTTGPGGSIQQGSYIIPHLVFRDPSMAEDVVRKCSDYEPSIEWGVYEDREFFWRTPDPSRNLWNARLDQGARPSFDGPAAQTLVNGVLVTYKDPAGVPHTVGPPGSNAEVTDTSLADPSSTNPANQLGIRKWAHLDLQEPTGSGGATQVGSAWLNDHLAPQRRGQIELPGMVEHHTKGPRPSWAVRAGDYLKLTDAANPTDRRIIETRYRHQTRTITCTLDNANTALDSLMQRFGAALVGVI